MNEEIELLSFEDALKKLEEAAAVLKSGSASLDECISVYDKSILYYNRCKELIDNAKQKIEIYNPSSGQKEDFDEY